MSTNIKVMKQFMCASVFLLCGCEQARVDAQLEELCKKDGGIKIYEKVNIPKDQFKYGVPNFLGQWEGAVRAGGGYRVIRKNEVLKADKPTLEKRSYAVIRETDQNLLGTFVYYQRIGGDIMWRPGPDSFNDCPKDLNENIFINSVFIKGS